MKLLEHFKELSLHPKNAQELKGVILKLAVKGKLSNLASDYQQIPLSELGAWAIGSGFPKSEQGLNNMEILFAKVSDMNIQGNERFINTTNNSISRETASKIRAKIHPKGTVVFPKIGGAIATNKRRILIQDTCIDNNCLGIIPKENVLHEWLFMVLSSIDFTEYQTGTSVPALSQKIIGEITVSCPPLEEQKAIVEVVNTLLAEVEQLESLTKERIQLKESFVVSALNKFTESENTQKEWNFLQQHFSSFFTEKKNIKSLRETILQLAVQGKLTEGWRVNNPNTEPASELLKRIEAEKQKLIAEKMIKKEKPLPIIEDKDKPYDLPESWVWCRLRDLVTILGDGIHGTPSYTPNGPVHFVNGNNLSDGVIEIKPNTKTVSEEEAIKHHRELNERTVLVSINGTIGNTAFYNGEKVMLGKSACYFNLMKELNKDYVRQLLKTNYFIDHAMNSATGTTIKNVSLRTMREFVVPLPSIKEQQVIVEKVISLIALCDELEQQIETSQTQIEQLMQSCLKEVFENDKI